MRSARSQRLDQNRSLLHRCRRVVLRQRLRRTTRNSARRSDRSKLLRAAPDQRATSRARRFVHSPKARPPKHQPFADAAALRASSRANLLEEPRHPQTVGALVGVLSANGQSDELATLLADQAQLAEASNDPTAALNFWSSAANVAEERLGDSDAAMTYFGRVVAIAPNASALDALSRLSLARQDFAGAADYLTQLRECVADEERPGVTLRLAD